MQAATEVRRAELKNGDVYEGEWLLGKRHGVGTHVSAHGENYRGGWQRDQRHGNGTLTRN